MNPPAKATIITGEAQSKIKNQITSLSICPSSTSYERM